MTSEEFEQLVAEEFDRAIPERFLPHIKNVAFLVEDEPSPEVRAQEGLGVGDTLLGYYRGIPTPQRGDLYGMGATLPDTITLYRIPIGEEATHLVKAHGLPEEAALRKVVRETIWHEVAHHFGMDEHEVRTRELGRLPEHDAGDCESCSA